MKYKQIEEELIKMYGIDPRDTSRDEHVIKARNLLIHCLRYYSSEISSNKKICYYLGLKQHGTVINALDSFNSLCYSDKAFKKKADVFIDYIAQHQDSFLLRQEVDISNRAFLLENNIKMFKQQLKQLR